MAKQRLFQPKPTTNDKREPHEKFSDFAAKVVTVPKSQIDEREKRWKRKRR